MSEDNNEETKAKVVTLNGEQFEDTTEEKEPNKEIVDALEFLLSEAKEGKIDEFVYVGRIDDYAYYKNNVGNMSMVTFGTLQDQALTYREEYKYVEAVMNGTIIEE